MAHECITCTSRIKEGVFVYVSQIYVCHMHVGTSLLLCKCEHMLLEKGFFFFFFSIYPPSLLMSQGFQRCDDFDILACGVPLQPLLTFFFFARQLRSFVFKLLCCSRSPCSPDSCVLPLLPPPDSEQQKRTFVLPNNSGGQLKELLCAINVSDSPPNLRHLQREAAACPRRLVPGLCTTAAA